MLAYVPCSVKHNVSLSDKEKQYMASAVLLAAMCIPLPQVSYISLSLSLSLSLSFSLFLTYL